MELVLSIGDARLSALWPAATRELVLPLIAPEPTAAAIRLRVRDGSRLDLESAELVSELKARSIGASDP